MGCPAFKELSCRRLGLCILQLVCQLAVVIILIDNMNCGKLLNPHFIGVMCFISFNYFVFVFQFMLALHPAT